MPNLDYAKEVNKYYNARVVNDAFEKLKKYEKELKIVWKKLAKMYSPSGGEISRAKFIRKRLTKFGISNAYIDGTGNVVGFLEGNEKGPNIAFLGTMDDLKTIAERVKGWHSPIQEKNGRLIGPGTFITGSCVSIVGLARLFTLPEIHFNGKIYFVGVVKEETGLEGIKRFLIDHPDEIDYIIDVFGGLGRIHYGALGINMFKVHFIGPGGHTMSGRLPNVTKGIAKAIDRIYSIPLPNEIPEKEFADFGVGRVDLSGHYLNIAMLEASKVINHQSKDGWFSVDLRSMSNDVKESVKKKILSIVEEVAKEENLEWWFETIIDFPAAQISGFRDSRLVRVAEEATKILGSDAFLSNMGSTNMNIGIVNQIPSIMIAGNEGGNRDTFEEYGNIEPIFTGIKLYFLIGMILTNAEMR